jgi:hypothetical protein
MLIFSWLVAAEAPVPEESRTGFGENPSPTSAKSATQPLRIRDLPGVDSSVHETHWALSFYLQDFRKMVSDRLGARCRLTARSDE